jgi:hypothetical protein
LGERQSTAAALVLDFVSFDAHNLCSYNVYFVANQQTFTSRSTALNSTSAVTSSAFLCFASAAAKASASPRRNSLARSPREAPGWRRYGGRALPFKGLR